MSCLTINGNSVIVAKGLCFDYFDETDHTVVEIQSANTKPQENDRVQDIVTSSDGKYLALITSITKQLIIYDLPLSGKHKSYVLPRSASKIRFTNQNQVLIADKSGDALIYTNKEGDTGTKILGHLSLLLDILQTDDEKYIITTDRDEKIKVSNYPNTYNIQTYCMGHREFVNHIELLPHDVKYLTSTSGDGCVKVWDYITGSQSHNIDTYLDVNDDQLKQSFAKFMDSEGVEVSTLPIVHYTVTKLDDSSSLLAVAVHTFNKLLLYKLQSINKQFSHILLDKLDVGYFPAAMKFNESSLYVYNDSDSIVNVYNINHVKDGSIAIKLDKTIKMFENKALETTTEHCHESVKIFYKRKFDNVQEYQERKKLRLEKQK